MCGACVNNHPQALEVLTKAGPKLTQFIEETQLAHSGELAHCGGFSSLLSAPCQRMPKMLLLLKELIKARRNKVLKRDESHPKFDRQVHELKLQHISYGILVMAYRRVHELKLQHISYGILVMAY